MRGKHHSGIQPASILKWEDTDNVLRDICAGCVNNIAKNRKKDR